MIDVIMPVHPKDLGTLELCIDSVKKYVEGVRRVIIVSNRRLSDNAEWFDLELFPFGKDSVREIHGHSKKNGWYLMQLIKLYAPICIPDIAEVSLSCDSDTIFLNPVTLNENNFPIWPQTHNQAKQGIQQALNDDNFLQKLNPDIYKDDVINTMTNNKYSIEPISPIFSYNKSILESLMNDIENYHNNKDPFWKIFLNSSNGQTSGASEHQSYFLYCISKASEIFKYRHNYKWRSACEGDTKNQINLLPTKTILDKYQKEGWHWLAFQSHMRGIRIHNYKELCLMCGKQKQDCSETGCNNDGARERELANI